MARRFLLPLFLVLLFALLIAGFPDNHAAAQDGSIISPTPSATRVASPDLLTEPPLLTSAASLNVEFVGQHVSGVFFENVTVDGDYAYLVDAGTGLHIYDVSNPAAPDRIKLVNTPGHSNDVAVAGGYAYLAHEPGIRVFDVSDPSNSFEVGSSEVPTYAQSIALQGASAFMIGGGGLSVIDITDPASPEQVGHVPVYAESVVVSGDFAYVSGGSSGSFYIFNVATPANPFIVGSDYVAPGAWDIAVSNNYAYVTSTREGLLAFDVSDPANPVHVATHDTPGVANGVAVSGNYAYVADMEAGVRVLDISNPANPTEVGFYDTPGSANRLTVSGDYIFVADSLGGLLILRFTGAELPDQQLANRYAPIVRMHVEDKMIPMGVDMALDYATCLKRQPDRTADCETSNVTLSLLASDIWRNDTNAYIDFMGNPTGIGSGSSQDLYENYIMDRARQAPVVYAHITPDNRSDGRRVIQYWIYYYYNNWRNQHEGDWEMVQVELDSGGRPDYATYSQHNDGTRREWASVATSDDRPIVYPAKGSHASYFFPGYYLGLLDRTASESSYVEWQPRAQLVDVNTSVWLQFAGHWGEKDFRANLGFSGPSSPAKTPELENPKWYDPLWWSSQLPFDEQAEHNKGKPRISAALDCQLGIENTTTGTKWGRIGDGVYDEINAVEAIRNITLSRTTTILHGDAGQFQQKYRLYLEGCNISSVSEQGALGAASSPLVVVEFVDIATDEVVTLTYDVPIDWDAVTSTATIVLSPDEAADLRVDLDGDESVDVTEPPASIKEEPLYPTPLANLIADPTTGNAPLTVTFGDASTGFPTAWLWNFGDGETSTEQHPTHVYLNAGSYNVSLTVTNPTASDIETKTSYVTVTLPVAVTSFTPTSGPVGTVVSITGTSLGDATGVTFNGVAAAAFTAHSSTQISATVPDGAVTGKIQVTTPSGTAESVDLFSVIPASTIGGFSPPNGPVGTSVTITGANFTGATAVTFNGVNATSFTVDSVTQITAAVPTGATTGKIAITTPGGTATSAADFTVMPAPTITGFDPTTGSVGSVVTLTGNGFTQVTQILFGDQPATTFTEVSDTQIDVVVPATAVSGPITVITEAGEAVSNDFFHVLPTITGFTPVSGVVGTVVTISGTTLQEVLVVAFNNVPAPDFSLISNTEIEVTVPAGATTGPIGITSFSGSATSAADFTVTAPPPPASYLSPTSTGKVGIGAAAKSFTGADILSYVKATNTWDILYDGSYIKTAKNVGAFAFQGDNILLGFSAAQVVPGLGTTKVAPQDLVRFTPTSLGYNNTAGAFAWFFDGSDVGLTTSGEIIDALWIDAAGNLYLSTAGSGSVPVNSTNPKGPKISFQDEDILRFTPAAGSTGMTTAGTWALYWDPTKVTGMSAEDINGYWEDPVTGHRYVTIAGAFNLGNAAYGGKYAGNGTSILRFVPNAAAPGGWAPAEKLTWLAAGATLPAKFAIDGIEMAR